MSMTAVIRKKEHFKMVWKKDANGDVRWVQTIEDQFEDDVKNPQEPSVPLPFLLSCPSL